MPQLFADFVGPRASFRLLEGGGAHAQLYLVADATLFWADGTGTTTPFSPRDATGVITLLADQTTTVFDASRDIWLCCAVKGMDALYLLRERDYSHLDHLLTTSPWDSTDKQWAVLARIVGVDVIVFQQATTYLPLSEEGSMIYAHSPDGTTPVEPTELFMHPTGDTAPYQGQILVSVPDPDDPTNTSVADPAWSRFVGTGTSAAKITGDPMLRWNFSGAPETFSATADGMILGAKTDPAGTSAYLPQFLTASALGLVQADPANPPHEGDLLYYTGGKYEPLRITTVNGEVLTSNGTDPGWQPLVYALAKILSGAGMLLISDSGNTIRSLALGADRNVLTAKFSQPTWESIQDIILPHPGGPIDEISLPGGTTTQKFLTINTSTGEAAWASAQFTP